MMYGQLIDRYSSLNEDAVFGNNHCNDDGKRMTPPSERVGPKAEAVPKAKAGPKKAKGRTKGKGSKGG